MNSLRAAAVLLIAGSTASLALAEPHQQHGAHQHGAGDLNIAVDKNILMMELSLPAMNVVGFEHQPKTDKERKTLQEAIEKLKNGAALFQPTAAANCKLTGADVQTTLANEHHEHEEHKHEEHGEHKEESHADFDVDYSFECANPSELRAIQVNLFQQFAGTDHLNTQVITRSGQTGKRLSAKRNIVSLN